MELQFWHIHVKERPIYVQAANLKVQVRFRFLVVD
jgi:hypothetical protein